MTSDVTVRRLTEKEWQAFRDLRLASLRTDPLAFGSTLARESAYTEEKWRDWTRGAAGGSDAATFVAVGSAGDLVGMVGVFVAEGAAQVWGMWVRPDYRGKRIGRRLMETLLEWMDRLHPDGPAIILDVNPSQAAAVRVYQAAGFAFNGTERPLGHDPPAVTRQMVRELGSR